MKSAGVRNENPRDVIAEYLGCERRLVALAFRPEPIPEQLTKTELNKVSSLKERYERLSIHSRTVVQTLKGMPIEELELLQASFPNSVEQLEALHNFFFEQENALMHIGDADRSGGKEPASDVIARGVARAFVMLGKPMKFGHSLGEPNTEFGKAVEVALRAFESSVGWRSPTERAKKAFETDPMLWRRAPDTNSP